MKGLLTGIALLAAAPALAQPNCGNRDEIVASLAEKYGEVQIGRGLTQNKGLLEIYAAAEMRTWTILLTNPGQPTCIMSVGNFWEFEELRSPEEQS